MFQYAAPQRPLPAVGLSHCSVLRPVSSDFTNEALRQDLRDKQALSCTMHEQHPGTRRSTDFTA